MGNAPWQKRIKAAGLTQKVLARLLGRAENTVSRQLAEKWEDGIVPQNVWSPIIAWEIMTDEQRRLWVERAEHERARQEDRDASPAPSRKPKPPTSDTP